MCPKGLMFGSNEFIFIFQISGDYEIHFKAVVRVNLAEKVVEKNKVYKSIILTRDQFHHTANTAEQNMYNQVIFHIRMSIAAPYLLNLQDSENFSSV